VIDFELEGKVAIVTGASRGLGRAAATGLIEQGVRLLAVARTLDDLKELESFAPENVRARQCDMHDTGDVANLPGEAIDAFGGLDIIVNNAGIAPAGRFLEQDEQVWDDVIAINVTAPATLTRAAGKHLIGQGSGKIINIASTSGILGKAMLVAYSASKGALLQFPAKVYRLMQLLRGRSQLTHNVPFSTHRTYSSAACAKFLSSAWARARRSNR